jgi:Mrp family chromosome partitioning ATPase
VLEPRPSTAAPGSATGVTIPLDANQAETELQVIKSERLLTYVFDSLNLEKHPDLAIPPPGILGWLRDSIKAVFSSEAARARTPGELRQIAFANFAERVGVRRVGQSYVVEVWYTSSDPVLTPRVANATVSAYLWQSLASKSDKSKNGAEFVQGRVNALSAQVSAAAAAVATGALPDAPTSDADARIIGAAIQPLGPSAPRRGLIIALGAVIGLTTGLFALTFACVFDRRVRTAEALTRATGLQCLAIVPEVSRWRWLSRLTNSNLGTLASSCPEGKFAGAIRDIRASIMLARSAKQGSGHDAVALVSWTRGAGCTLISTNLAHVIQESGENVTIIDADIHHETGSLTDQYPHAAVSAPITLADVLTSNDDFDESALLDLDGIALLPARSPSPRKNQTAYLSAPKMRQVIEKVRSRSEVLLDLPPLCAGADARAAARHANFVLLVVVAGGTTSGELTSAVRALESVGANVIGAVLNRASI